MRYFLAALLALMVPASIAEAQTRTYINTPTTWAVDNVAGSDANPCTVALPCATIQHALTYMTANFDFAVEGLLKLVTTGVDYVGNVQLPRPLGSAGTLNGMTGLIRIQGDTANSAAVTVNGGSSPAIVCVYCSGIILDSFRVTSPGNNGVVIDAQAHMLMVGMNFGPAGFNHVFVEHMAFAEFLVGPVVISGSAQSHIAVTHAGEVVWQGGNNYVFTGSPSMTYFISTSVGGFGNATGISSYSGARSVGSPGNNYPSGNGVIAPAVGWP